MWVKRGVGHRHASLGVFSTSLTPIEEWEEGGEVERWIRDEVFKVS